ncbi:hypothetical protein GCM10010174_61390 [Kutzneria viridogrisea]|uniref:Uncharacterized protein n=1 Tax=Kutzneria viridogrisea TaxID=47990 RepID=A0ABR6BGD2_9PSEU|nr:hypothetical protein [Kutzneria viridogrisea]
MDPAPVAAQIETMRQQILASLWQVGTVTGSSTSPARVTVTVQGGSMTVPRLASYTTPAVGRAVLIASTPVGWIALHEIA